MINLDLNFNKKKAIKAMMRYHSIFPIWKNQTIRILEKKIPNNTTSLKFLACLLYKNPVYTMHSKISLGNCKWIIYLENRGTAISTYTAPKIMFSIKDFLKNM